MPFFPQAAHLGLPLMQFASLPGGPCVMGSAFAENAPPHWIHLPPFHIGVNRVTEGQYQSLRNPRYCLTDPEDHFVTNVSWSDAMLFASRLSHVLGMRLGLPTEAEWEYAARGPAVNLRKVMREEGVRPSDFASFTERRYENFVARLETGAAIMTDPTDKRIRDILKTNRPLYAWRVYGDTNAYGVRGMVGGAWEYAGGDGKRVGDWNKNKFCTLRGRSGIASSELVPPEARGGIESHTFRLAF